MHETLDIRKLNALKRLAGIEYENIFNFAHDEWYQQGFDMYKTGMPDHQPHCNEEFSFLHVQTYLRSWPNREAQFVEVLRFDSTWVHMEGDEIDVIYEDMDLYDSFVIWIDQEMYH